MLRTRMTMRVHSKKLPSQCSALFRHLLLSKSSHKDQFHLSRPHRLRHLLSPFLNLRDSRSLLRFRHLLVEVWTVDDANGWRTLSRYGVDGVITDRAAAVTAWCATEYYRATYSVFERPTADVGRRP